MRLTIITKKLWKWNEDSDGHHRKYSPREIPFDFSQCLVTCLLAGPQIYCNSCCLAILHQLQWIKLQQQHLQLNYYVTRLTKFSTSTEITSPVMLRKSEKVIVGICCCSIGGQTQPFWLWTHFPKQFLIPDCWCWYCHCFWFQSVMILWQIMTIATVPW